MPRPLTSTLSTKGQTTIPAKVRRELSIEPGDTIRYELEDGSVRMRKISPMDVERATAIESTLSEWTSADDDDL